MKNNLLTIAIVLLILYSISGCSASPTPEPTQIPTSTSTPVPAPTSTDTPPPTSTETITPTVVSTLAFYSVDPTIVATAEGCSAFPAEICVSGITINLSGRKLAKYKVTVSSLGFSGMTTFDCPQKALLVSFGDNMAPVICNSNYINFVTVGLTEFTLTINWDGGSVTQTIHPAFEIAAPQGPQCTPQCSMGNAEINIP